MNKINFLPSKLLVLIASFSAVVLVSCLYVFFSSFREDFAFTDLKSKTACNKSAVETMTSLTVFDPQEA